MADEIKVSPTPIQRNAHDVAIELLHIYLQGQFASDKPMDIDYLRETYLKLYATARVAEYTKIGDLKKYVPNLQK